MQWLLMLAEPTPPIADMFQLKLHVLEKVLRPVLVYLFLVAALHIFGKRELAQLNPFDLVVLLSLSNTVQNAIIGDDNSLTGGLVGAFTLLLLNYLVVRFLFRHRRLDQFIEGKPVVLIEHGKLRHQALAKELLTEAELHMVARRQGFKHLREIDRCVLDANGTFTVEGKAPPQAEQQHAELLKRFDELSRQLAETQQQLKSLR